MTVPPALSAAHAALGWPGVVLPQFTLRKAAVFPVVESDPSEPGGLRIVGSIVPIGRRYNRPLVELYTVRDLGLIAMCLDPDAKPRKGLPSQASYYGVGLTQGATLLVPAKLHSGTEDAEELAHWQRALAAHAAATGTAL